VIVKAAWALALLCCAVAAYARKVARLALIVAVCFVTIRIVERKLTCHQNAARCVVRLKPLDKSGELILSRFVGIQ
jgi:hypothetical protein